MLLIAIQDYLRLADQAVTQFRDVTGQDNLMEAWRNGLIAKSGELSGIHYEFHGSGLYLESSLWQVEVDFLPGSVVGGFDSWKLWQMVKGTPQLYPSLVDHQLIRDELQKLLIDGAITPVDGTNLYRLEGASKNPTPLAS